MNTRTNRQLRLACAIGVATMVPAVASADGRLEEIVVTAQKREQSLQDVPISVAAVSGDRLVAENRNEIADLRKMIAGFSFKDGSNDADRAIQIRGVGTATFSRGVEQSVGTVIDGVVASSAVSGLLDMGDVERVEVLRGPQGMLFGKNSSAGLLNITTKAPTSELSYGGSTSFGDENERKYSAYLSGPLASENVLGRISVYSNERDGIIENLHPTGPDYNDRDEWGLKVKLLFEPSDDFNLLLSYTHAERKQNCCVLPVESYHNPAYSALVSGLENDKVSEEFESPSSTDLDSYSVTINYQLGTHSLTSITAHTNNTDMDNTVGQGLPFRLVPINLGEGDISQFSQELRLTSSADQTVSYVAGLYYYKNELDREFVRFIDATPVFGIWLGMSNDTAVENESYAAFGQATWNINETTRLSLGLRYNHEDVSMEQSVGFPALPYPNPGGFPVFPESTPGNIAASTTDDHISWRVIGEKDIVEDMMLYASVSRGYKGPGANTLPTGINKPIVDPEIPTNYELGVKSEWWDGRMRLNASIFHTVFDDFQASLFDGGTPPQFFLDNAGKLTTEGLEVELSSQVSENLYVAATLASIEAVFDAYQGATCYPNQTAAQGCVGGVQDLSGKEMPYSPDLTYSLFARYDIGLGSLPFNAYVQGSYYWQDEVQYQTDNNPATIGDSYGLTDVAIGIESDSGTYSAQLYVKNLFDEFYVTNLVGFSGLLGVNRRHSLDYTYTRRVGIALNINF